MSSEIKTVLFDFDGTLTTTDSTKYLLLSLILYRPFLIGRALQLLKKRKCGDEAFQLKKNELIGELIKGYTPTVLKRRLWLFKLLVSQIMRKEMINKLNCYISADDLIIIATASPDFAMHILFPQNLKIIGTRFIVEFGRYNGQVDGNPCFGENKAKAVSSYLKKRDISHADIAFSDHISDLPFLMCAKEAYLLKNNEFRLIENPKYPS